MNLTDEFKKYATKECGINSLYYDKIIASMTPYIMEERQLNVAQMDVFSRLMMDRIIFLGTDVNDQVANIITAQLLFLESVDSVWQLLCRQFYCVQARKESVQHCLTHA